MTVWQLKKQTRLICKVRFALLIGVKIKSELSNIKHNVEVVRIFQKSESVVMNCRVGECFIMKKFFYFFSQPN